MEAEAPEAQGRSLYLLHHPLFLKQDSPTSREHTQQENSIRVLEIRSPVATVDQLRQDERRTFAQGT